MVLSTILGVLALLSLVLLLWQWFVGCRFPLHSRTQLPPARDALPAVTLLKPLKGCDFATEDCLRSWFAQQYSGPVQILLGVASDDDPVCSIVRRLLGESPFLDAQLVVCGPPVGANSKVSKLLALERLAKHDIVIVSDADVRVPPDFLASFVEPLAEQHAPRHEAFPKCGLVNCFYHLANPSTPAMQLEAIAINADFWSSVLQARSLKPLDFALGAVMGTRCRQLAEIGGFGGLVDCLADDYQLGHRLAGRGYRIELSPLVVECWSEPMGWAAVWKHQLRWARTIRICQPAPYFFSILSNVTLWPLLWLAVNPSRSVLAFALGCWLLRIATALHLQGRLTRSWSHLAWGWLAPVKDLLQAVLWLVSFLGNTVEWRGQRMRLGTDGTLERTDAAR